MTDNHNVCGHAHHPFERLEAITAACLNRFFAAMIWLTRA